MVSQRDSPRIVKIIAIISACVRLCVCVLTSPALVSLENLPAAHASQTLVLDPPSTVEYLPVPHPVQF